jgi:hypothetical protein
MVMLLSCDLPRANPGYDDGFVGLILRLRGS